MSNYKKKNISYTFLSTAVKCVSRLSSYAKTLCKGVMSVFTWYIFVVSFHSDCRMTISVLWYSVKHAFVFAFLSFFHPQGSSVGKVTGWMAGIQFPVGARDFPPLHRVQTSSEAHPVFCVLGTRALCPAVKLTTHLHLVLKSKMVPLYLFSPYISWPGA